MHEDRDIKLCEAGIAYTLYANVAVVLARTLREEADPTEARTRLSSAAAQLHQRFLRAGADIHPRTDFKSADEIFEAMQSELLMELGSRVCGAIGERAEWVFLLSALIGGAITAASTGLPKELVQPIRANASVIAGKIDVPNDVLEACLAEEDWGPLKAHLSTGSGSRRVFVVHGRSDAALHAVARFLGQLRLDPVVLREQPNRGRAIIEKFLDYSDVAFAVVILTPDDIGGLRGDPPDRFRPRARQNVVLELGFFLGKLGRDRVCALCEADIEVPSDYSGVLFVPLDPHGAWRLELARELRAAGIEVHMNGL